MNSAISNSAILNEFRTRTPKSAAKYLEARNVLPSGIVHDARYMTPHPIYVDRAHGSRKWDIDGHEYIDYYGGHGSLMLGHSHPTVVQEVQKQVEKGSQLAACSELEVSWAELIQAMIPSAERVRFTSSGTEATHLAFRLARAATNKTKIIRFRNHFHGWHDHVAFGVNDHMDGTPTVGVATSVANNIILVDPNDTGTVARLLEQDDDIAGVILEPLGASSGTIPTPRKVLKELRDLTRSHGVLLIFDEVVTAFRVSPGGVQGLYGIIPDITTMAKIVSGGLPGGAVGARKDILDWIDHSASKDAGRERINHQGTNNGNLVCAAAGIATLTAIRTSDLCQRASETTAALRRGMNEILEEEGVPWAVYGEHSFFHIFTNPAHADIKATTFDVAAVPGTWLKSDKRETVLSKLRLSMLNNGVDLKSWRGGVVSGVHSERDVAETLAAWRNSLRALKLEEDVLIKSGQ
jgi:glutamate-1-semialdehyde 2,1-aminomutase